MRGHRPPPPPPLNEIAKLVEIDPRFLAFGRALLKDAHVVLVEEDEWEAADDAISSQYDALLAAKEFLETLQIMAPFHPQITRLTNRLAEVSDMIETALCSTEHYLDTGKGPASDRSITRAIAIDESKK